MNQKEFLNFGNLKGYKFKKLKREKHTYVQWHNYVFWCLGKMLTMATPKSNYKP